MDYHLLNFAQGELEVEAEDEGFGPQGSKATKTKQEQQKVRKGTLRTVMEVVQSVISHDTTQFSAEEEALNCFCNAIS